MRHKWVNAIAKKMALTDLLDWVTTNIQFVKNVISGNAIKQRTIKWGRHVTRASQAVPVVKNLPDNVGDTREMGLIPEMGRSPTGGNGKPPQYCCLKNSMDRERSLAGYSPWGGKESDTTEHAPSVPVLLTIACQKIR